MLKHSRNPSTKDIKAKGSRIQGQVAQWLKVLAMPGILSSIPRTVEGGGEH